MVTTEIARTFDALCDAGSFGAPVSPSWAAARISSSFPGDIGKIEAVENRT
jgi:hypothetical protein